MLKLSQICSNLGCSCILYCIIVVMTSNDSSVTISIVFYNFLYFFLSGTLEVWLATVSIWQNDDAELFYIVSSIVFLLGLFFYTHLKCSCLVVFPDWDEMWWTDDISNVVRCSNRNKKHNQKDVSLLLSSLSVDSFWLCHKEKNKTHLYLWCEVQLLKYREYGERFAWLLLL